MDSRKNYLSLALALFAFSIPQDVAFAQEAGGAVSPSSNVAVVTSSSVTQLPLEVIILRGVERELKEKYKKNIFYASNIPSVVFTPSQYALLSEARIGFNAKIPLLKNGKPANNPDPDDPNYRPPPSVRKLQLGGIVFNTPDEWTIYLNGKRITPDLLPSEAVDLRVYKDFIELRWFDVQTNKIFPVRLRPNQTFNLDARVFLPG